LCGDFYNPTVGIAFVMLDVQTWEGHATRPLLFTAEAPKSLRLEAQTAMSVTHSAKAAWPRQDRSPFGLVFEIGPASNFWAYFMECNDGSGLSAQCTDGFKCDPDLRHPVSMTYEDFQEKKNEIVSQTGTQDCKVVAPTTFNEFDTNGLSSRALAGVFVTKSGGATERKPPSPQALCTFLSALKKTNASWPIYVYESDDKTSSSLYLQSLLKCDSVRADDLWFV